MGWDEPHAVEDVVQAAVAKGSDYRFVNVVGARVSLVLDQSTGRVVVTRGNGAVKIGYLAGRHSRRIAAALKAGYQYEGAIADISAGPGGKYLSLRLDRPVRGDDL